MSDILTVKDLNVYYYMHRGISGKKEKLHALKDISFSMHEGEILGIAGESGCGKSTLAKTICGMNKNFTGTLILTCKSPQMIFQDPAGSLNPSKKVGWILEEALRSGCKEKISKEETEKRIFEAAEDVKLGKDLLTRYPYELSGGQRQRVGIAAAIIRKPKLVIADEPVSALDVTIQAQIMDLLKSLHEKHGISTIFISHDLRVIYKLCDRVIVMKEGRMVEIGDRDAIYSAPKEEYTKELLLASGIGE